jgi:hypothetical protein
MGTFKLGVLTVFAFFVFGSFTSEVLGLTSWISAVGTALVACGVSISIGLLRGWIE